MSLRRFDPPTFLPRMRLVDSRGIEKSARPMILNISTLDDPNSVMPAFEIFCDDALR
jgi:hypothetical protein